MILATVRPHIFIDVIKNTYKDMQLVDISQTKTKVAARNNETKLFDYSYDKGLSQHFLLSCLSLGTKMRFDD